MTSYHKIAKTPIGAMVFLALIKRGNFMGVASIAELLSNNVTMNNDFKRSLKTMNNVRVWKTSTNRISSEEAETKAMFLVERLKAPNCRNFFLKCIYHLSEADIQNALEAATRPYVKCPAKYFNRVCKIKLSERGL